MGDPYSDLRYVRGRCRECGQESPVCDQKADVRRSLVGEWWEQHKRDSHTPALDWEVAPAPIGADSSVNI